MYPTFVMFTRKSKRIVKPTIIAEEAAKANLTRKRLGTKKRLTGNYLPTAKPVHSDEEPALVVPAVEEEEEPMPPRPSTPPASLPPPPQNTPIETVIDVSVPSPTPAAGFSALEKVSELIQDVSMTAPPDNKLLMAEMINGFQSVRERMHAMEQHFQNFMDDVQARLKTIASQQVVQQNFTEVVSFEIKQKINVLEEILNAARTNDYQRFKCVHQKLDVIATHTDAMATWIDDTTNEIKVLPDIKLSSTSSQKAV